MLKQLYSDPGATRTTHKSKVCIEMLPLARGGILTNQLWTPARPPANCQKQQSLMGGCDDDGDGDADGGRKDHGDDNDDFEDDDADVKDHKVEGDGDVVLESKSTENQFVAKHGQTNQLCIVA